MIRWWTAGIAIGVALSGCVTGLEQPAFSGATMSPQNLEPGDAAVITVKVNDNFGVVKTVEGRVLEDTTITFYFRDDGTKSDEVAGDGIWTMKVQVPFNAPPGGYTFEIQGFDQDGNLVVVHDENKEAVPLSTSLTLDITYPEAEAEPESEETE